MSDASNKQDIMLIETEEGLDKLIALTSTMGFSGRAHLFRQVREQRLLVMECTRDAVFSMKLLKRQHKPMVVLLGDDDYQSTGPSSWAALPKILRWASRGVIHATGGDTASYDMAATMAVACRRLVLVETDSRHADEWGHALLAARPPVPFIGLVPPAGEAHPVTPSWSEQH